MRKNQNVPSLIAGCRQMKEASQIGLYRHFYSYGIAICLRYAANREAALEILNDAFLKVFLKIDQYDPQFPFKPWLRRILIHAAVDYYRKYDRSTVEDYSSPEVQSTTYNEALDQLEFDDLLLLMQSLPSAYRMVFNLYVIEGYSHAEIAERLGISVGTSKSNLAKARQKIKILLEQQRALKIKSEKYG